ncbi:MAG: CDP-alcohol phosphatidyltransferase family protein [Acidobacteriota bacterium]
MASVYDLKPAFQRLLRPLVRGLARLGVSPNQITVGALLLSLLWGIAITLRPTSKGLLLALPALLLLRMALNAADGMLAREHDLRSPLGALLNELGDVLSDSTLYLPLALVPGFEPRLAVLTALAAAITEVAGLAALAVGAERRYDGPMGKSDRALVFGLVGLLLGLGLAPHPWLLWVQGAVLALLAITILRRVQGALRAAP